MNKHLIKSISVSVSSFISLEDMAESNFIVNGFHFVNGMVSRLQSGWTTCGHVVCTCKSGLTPLARHGSIWCWTCVPAAIKTDWLNYQMVAVKVSQGVLNSM